jgi:DNA-binding response OmpR family regulator
MNIPPRPVILLVEDDPDIRLMLADRLTAHGYGVREAADSHVALRLLSRISFSAILLEADLRGRDGFALLESIQRKRPLIPVIMISAHSAYQHRALTAGAHAFFHKPVDLRAVLIVLQRAIQHTPEAALSPNTAI